MVVSSNAIAHPRRARKDAARYQLCRFSYRMHALLKSAVMAFLANHAVLAESVLLSPLAL
jgi:hypothetical protein